MADLSEVLNQLVAKAAGAVYPNGTASPSVAGVDVRCYPGWPVPNVLEADLKSGKVHISVYPLPTERRSPNSLGRPYRVVTDGASTIVATVNGSTVTLSGTATASQNIHLTVNGSGYHYYTQSNDTLSTIATALAVQIPGATSSGAQILIPSAYSITAATGGTGESSRETKRQVKEFQITVWSSSPAIRDTVSSVVDSALSDTSHMAFADQSYGILLYSRTFQTDQLENAKLYRRDLVYSVDYATTQIIKTAVVVATVLNITKE